MEPIPFSSIFYQIVFSLAVLTWAVPELAGTVTQQARGNAIARDRWSGPVVRVLLVVGIFLAIFLSVVLTGAAIPWARLPLFWAGIALMVIGVAFRWYAIRALGRYFTRDVATHVDQQVVQSGPYRLIRHPSYAGEMLVILGIGLALGNWIGLAVILGLPLAGFSYRMQVEEHALLEALGEPYREYMTHTHRLIPFIY